MSLRRVAALCAALLALAGCRRGATAIDPDLARCVPASAQVVAGVDLARLRRAPLYRQLPASMRALAEPVQGATNLLLAMTDDGLLAAARGDFREAPPGATLLSRKLALAGGSEAVRAARAQYRSGKTEAADLIAQAEPLALRHPLWIAARGTATLPFAGNLANLNRVLQSTAFTTVGVDFGEALTIEAAGICRGPDDAQRLEETLRAIISLASLRQARGFASTIRLRTEGDTVRFTASANPKDLDPLFR